MDQHRMEHLEPRISRLSNAHFLRLWSEAPAALREELARLRAQSHPDFFAAHYLPHHVRLPFAAFHRMLFRWHLEMTGDPGSRVGLRRALAAPRGSAKSTVASLLLPLHDLVFRRERYLLLVSATERQAQARLRSITRELGGAPLGALVAVEDASARHLVANGIRVEAYGAGQEMRGLSWGPWRPTKIILDDAEASASADSPRRRESLLDWYREVVEHLGYPGTHLLVVGTVLHAQGLLPTLLARPDFNGARLRAIERFSPATALWEAWRARLCDLSDPDRRAHARAFFEANREAMEAGTAVLWPAREDYEVLMAQLVAQGRRAFYQEKQNEPLGPEDAVFDTDRVLLGVGGAAETLLIHRTGGADHPLRVAAFPREAPRFGYLDSALAGTRRSDFAALATVACLPDGTLFAESLWVRRAAPSTQVEHLFDQHEARPFASLALEGTGFQELLAMPLEAERERRRAGRRAWDLPIAIVKPRLPKSARIAALEPLLASGVLVLAPTLPEEFWEELAGYPRVAHDDALDALAGAVELARGAAAAGQGGVRRAGARPLRQRGF